MSDPRSRLIPRESIITSRLLVLQSKRLMLDAIERRLDSWNTPDVKRRFEELRGETEAAQDRYRRAILEWGSTEDIDYWVMAYSRLIDKGNVIVKRMREANLALPPAERYQVSADIEVMEHLVEDWTGSLRKSMAAAVA
ncbi:MAG TPA: hypothetical protein VMP38_09015 [Candidatus Acidoferrum sp.]|nr:hypothetical protein [Candidatus Acidoferrum sp.]